MLTRRDVRDDVSSDVRDDVSSDVRDDVGDDDMRHERSFLGCEG